MINDFINLIIFFRVLTGTVIELNGSRIRLRLDGTDDRNDFWLTVDSDLIHPFEYSAKHGRKIQPPLGFGNDLSKWPKFLEKLINTAGENVFAAETCFKPAPVKPMRNEFKVGQKLEAVDPKNPHLICPATVKEIKRDKLLITFDGWSQSSQCWYSYVSRDIFPVGWCKLADHILQHPGNLTDNKKQTNVSLKQSNSTMKPVKCGKQVKQKLKSGAKKSPCPSERHNLSGDNNSLNMSRDNHVPSSSPNSTASTKQHIQTVAEQTHNKLPHIDLSIVKHEALDPNDQSVVQNSQLKHLNLNAEIDSLKHFSSAYNINKLNKPISGTGKSFY